jgi:D-proline reductase (dithiol) PrdB
VCHQTVSLVARYLEAAGIPTVVMGCAKDIVENVGVPRFAFSDFPLGNAAGRPNDEPSQAQTLELALKVLELAPGPRTTVQSPLRWADNPDWKLDFSNIEQLSEEEIAERRKAFDDIKSVARDQRAAAGLETR